MDTKLNKNTGPDQNINNLIPRSAIVPEIDLDFSKDISFENLTDFHNFVEQNTGEVIIVPKVQDEKINEKPNSRKAIYDLITQHRNNNLSSDETRQEKVSNYIKNHEEIDNKEFQELLLSRSGYLKKDFIPEEFVPQNLFKYYLHTLVQTLINRENKNKANLPSYEIDFDKYDIIKFSRDLTEKIRFVEENFEELKNLLKYDSETGFYCYEDIPIFCKHVFMTYDGKSLQEVSRECYKDGVCRYCGASMLNYEEISYDNIPLSAQSLLLGFCHSFNNVDQDKLFYRFYRVFTNIIRDNKDKFKNDNFTLAFCGVFIMKIVKELSGSTVDGETNIKLFTQTKIKKVFDKCREYFAQVGWTPKQVENTFSSPLLKFETDVKELIKTCSYNELSTDIDETYLDEILDKQNSKFNEIFKQGQDAIEKYNRKLFEIILNSWKYNYKKINSLNDIKSIVSKIVLPKLVNQIGEYFFNTVADVFCPAAISIGKNGHKFTGDKCSLCGMMKNKKNISEVYSKFHRIITEKSISAEISDKSNYQDRVLVKSDKELVAEIMGINVVNKLDILERIINNPDQQKDLNNFLAGLLKISIINIPENIDFYNKSIKYILDRRIIDKDNLLSNLSFISDNFRYIYVM